MTSSNIKSVSTTITENNGSKIKGIIFDFDGVLSSFHARIGWPITSAALRVKPDITRDQIYDMALTVLTMLSSIDQNDSKTTLIKFIFGVGKNFGMSNFQVLKFMITMFIVYRKNRKTVVPNIGVREVLREILAQDYKVILLTNTSQGIIDIAKQRIPEINEFDLILTRDDVKVLKPNAIGLIKAMEILGLEADEVIHIGDQASDIIAGKRAGTMTIAVNDETMDFYKQHLRNENPDFIIRDLRQLPNLLRFLRDCIIEDIRTTIDLTEKPFPDDLTINEQSSKPTP
ncbi:MAG: HAD family hydrolase [Candidatus Heimdallarchaeota archaeon]|nr:HAD family hydrolase [Candidatus Heimdallarchaeota archaeon]MBY8995675.1 HAD family hydrolase [Candidatus Heimdallarchaeota archaeon]